MKFLMCGVSGDAGQSVAPYEAEQGASVFVDCHASLLRRRGRPHPDTEWVRVPWGQMTDLKFVLRNLRAR